jgi:DeoR/GlpR family transcriptional regulator of sugar metabolism
MGSTSAARHTTLDKGVKIFKLIVEKQSVTVTEVAKAFRITKSTAHRFLATWLSKICHKRGCLVFPHV